MLVTKPIGSYRPLTTSLPPIDDTLCILSTLVSLASYCSTEAKSRIAAAAYRTRRRISTARWMFHIYTYI